MNIGGLAVLLVVIFGGVFGLVLIMSNTNMAAPVDSAGATTGLQDNLTRDNVTAKAPLITNFGTGVALIVAVMIMFGVIIYFVGARHPYKGRYQ